MSKQKKFNVFNFCLINIIFYVAMKQPRSTSQTITKLTKKALLPSFRQSKTISKMQEILAFNRSELFVNLKLFPLEISADKRNGDNVKLTLNSNDAVLQEGGRSHRILLNFIEMSNNKDWLQIDFGQIYHTLKVKKVGDENFPWSSFFSWQKIDSVEKKIGLSIQLKDFTKTSQKTIQNSVMMTINPHREDKSKQMKAFVANLMSRKLNRRSSELEDFEAKPSGLKKKSQIFKPKLGEQPCKNSILFKLNPPSTAGSILSVMSGARSMRKDSLEKKLQQSKFTRKSQKQTSIGDQSLYFNQKSRAIAQIVDSVAEEYGKNKQKFDSQPYFYQKSTISSHINNESNKRLDSFSRQQDSVLRPPPPQKMQQKIEDLQNRSQHQSQQQVEQEIKRSSLMLNSSIKNEDDSIKIVRSKSESSECFESKQIGSVASSGTIFQSKYQ